MTHFALWLLLILPFAGAVSCLFLRSPLRIVDITCTVSLLCGMLALTFVPGFLRGDDFFMAGGWIFLDALSAFHLAIMLAIFCLSSLYARSYFRDDVRLGHFELSAARQYGSLWLCAQGSMTLLLVSNNLGIMWVGMEMTTLLTAFLIYVHRSPHALEAMWKYLLICSVGIALAFIGTLLVAASVRGLPVDPAEALLWTKLMGLAPQLDGQLLRMGFLFVLIGYGTKAGLAPMHSWLPDAHSQAPAPVSALFSGFMLNAGLYCVMRYLALLQKASLLTEWGGSLLRLLGLISIVVAAAFILFQDDGKRLLAYSSVEHLGIITLGLGLGPAGIWAALFHSLNHSLCKTVGFFCMGRFGQINGTHDLGRLTGAIRQDRVWGLGLFLTFLVLLGAAPFAIFLSELLIVKAAVEMKAWAALGVFLFGTGAIFISVLKHAIAAAWGQPSPLPESVNSIVASASREKAAAATFYEIAIVLGPLAILLVLGLWMPDFFQAGLGRAADVIISRP